MTKAEGVYECTLPSSAQSFMGLVRNAENKCSRNNSTQILYGLGFL